MLWTGIAITILGFLISVLSVGITSNNGARLALVLVGLAACFFGIIGMINPAFRKNAIWRK